MPRQLDSYSDGRCDPSSNVSVSTQGIRAPAEDRVSIWGLFAGRPDDSHGEPEEPAARAGMAVDSFQWQQYAYPYPGLGRMWVCGRTFDEEVRLIPGMGVARDDPRVDVNKVVYGQAMGHSRPLHDGGPEQYQARKIPTYSMSRQGHASSRRILQARPGIGAQNSSTTKIAVWLRISAITKSRL